MLSVLSLCGQQTGVHGVAGEHVQWPVVEVAGYEGGHVWKTQILFIALDDMLSCRNVRRVRAQVSWVCAITELYLSSELHLNLLRVSLSLSLQWNVSACAPRVDPVRTAAGVCVRAMCCTERSTQWPVSLWLAHGWLWPISLRWSVHVQMLKVSSGSQEFVPPPPQWSPSGRRSLLQSLCPPTVTPLGCHGYTLFSNLLVRLFCCCFCFVIKTSYIKLYKDYSSLCGCCFYSYQATIT